MRRAATAGRLQHGGQNSVSVPMGAKVVSKNSRLPKEKMPYRAESTPGAEDHGIRKQEQKNISKMGDEARVFSRSADVVVGFRAIKCSTAKVCSLLEQRRKLVESEAGYELLAAAEADPVLAFASQALNQKSDTSGSAELRAAAKIFENEMAPLLKTRRPLRGKIRLTRMLRKHC